MMNYVLDLIVIVIVALTALISAKRGFVRVAIELAGFVAVIILTFIISTPLAGFTYDKIIEPPLVKSVGGATEATASQTVDSAWDALPDFLKSASEKTGISKENFSEKLTADLQGGTEDAAKSISQNIVKPIAERYLSMIISAVLIIVLMFAVRILAKFVNKLFSFSIAGKLNRTLGGIVGLLKGIILAMVFCLIISVLVAFTGGFLNVMPETIDDSVIFKFLCEIMPFNP